MNLEATLGFLRTHKLDGEHMETHEGPDQGWVTSKHPGFVARPCRVCGEIFICDAGSDAVECGGAHLMGVG